MPSVRFVIAWYLLLSLITLAFYGVDKFRAARSSRRPASRVPERTLHSLELVGGWPGALVAQQLFRHKRAKPAYMRIFWIIVSLHVVAWCWWLLR